MNPSSRKISIHSSTGGMTMEILGYIILIVVVVICFFLIWIGKQIKEMMSGITDDDDDY